MSGPNRISWPHAPMHRLGEGGVFFVTAATYKNQHYFQASTRLDVVQRGLLKVAVEFGWQLEAWAVFSNHYHFVGRSPEGSSDASSLKQMLSKLHEKTAKWVDRLDGKSHRKIWHNFWDTKLTYEKSYLARLNYTHQNAVKHGLVLLANQYRWCSAAWFERTASPAQVRTIYGMKIDRLNVADDYNPLMEPRRDMECGGRAQRRHRFLNAEQRFRSGKHFERSENPHRVEFVPVRSKAPSTLRSAGALQTSLDQFSQLRQIFWIVAWIKSDFSLVQK